MFSLTKRFTSVVVRAAHTLALITTPTVLWFGASPALAAPLVVDGSPSVVGNTVTSCLGTLNPYTTIQSAVGTAPSGATIQVCPGNYPEQVTIATPLTLKGVTDTTDNAGAAVITIPGGTFSGQFTQVDIQASGVTLSNIGVDGTNTNSIGGCFFGISLTGILFDSGSSGTLRQVTLRNQYVSNGSGGYCGSGTAVSATSAASVTVADSSVRNFDGAGIQVTTTSSVTVKTTALAPLTPNPGLSSTPNCVYANAPTAQVSGNTTSGCGTGVEVATTVSGSVSGNTIVGNGISSTGFGFLCAFVCTGITVSGNQIFNTDIGLSMKTSGESGAIVFQNNTVSGTAYGVYLFFQPNNTVSNNTIIDSGVGIYGVTGNTVSGNTYKTVTTLTQP